MQQKLIRSLLFFSIIATTSTKAQFKKGDKMVGVSIASALVNSGTADQTVTSIGSVTSKVNSYSVSISPSLGWFISDKTVAGAAININASGDKRTYSLVTGGNTFQKDQTNGFNAGLGAFVRNYFGTTSSFMPFGQININGGMSNLKREGFVYLGSSGSAYNEKYDGKSTGGFFFNAGINAGLTKMMGENTGLDFFIGYAYSYSKDTFKRTTLRDNGNDGTIDETKINETTTKFTNHGVQFGIGFQVYLRKK